jgi:hypothetical protein
MEASDYWSKVGAPRLRALITAYKESSRTKVTNSELASQVETRSGKKAGRAAFEHFVNGVREPYVSQLVAICEILEIDVAELLQPPTRVRQPLVHSAFTHTKSRKLLKTHEK